MTVHILNSAVMPHKGTYHLKDITESEFAKELKEAHEVGTKIKHYIGYPSTLTLCEQLTGLDLGCLNRDKTHFNGGDLFYVIRLKYRVKPNEKVKDEPNLEDFEFFRGVYHE